MKAALCLHQHPDLCTLSLRWLSPAPIYGGGVSPSAIGTNTPLAHMVVSPIVTCAGGVFPSTHWRRYRTCARVTCTVWWWWWLYNYIYFTNTTMRKFGQSLYMCIVCNMANSIFGRISMTEGRLYRVTELWALCMCTVGNNNNS